MTKVKETTEGETSDSAVYHKVQAERAWSRVLKLLERTMA
jgi:hypothetical protein